MDEPTIRPMDPADVPAAEQLSARAFHDLDRRRRRADEPEPQPRSPDASARWTERTTRFLGTDPAGSWVAEDADGLVGFATSVVREDVWALATFAVRPGAQGRGLGRRLLEPALAYGAGCSRGLLAASDDPRALRRYWAGGFALHPQVVLAGPVSRAALPAAHGVRAGLAEDREWMDDLDRTHRGGPHDDADHLSLADQGELLVTTDRRGYAYAGPSGPVLLSADSEQAARSLLVECLARTGERADVDHVTGANQWAVDLGLRVGLVPTTRGYLAVRGMEPPSPYVHHGALL